MRNEEFAAATERLALAKEIKRQEAELRMLVSGLELKRNKLRTLEYLARVTSDRPTPGVMVFPAVAVPQ